MYITYKDFLGDFVLKKKVMIHLVTKRKEIDEDIINTLGECFGDVGSKRDIRIPDYEGDISKEEYNRAVRLLLEYIFGDEEKEEFDGLYDDIDGDDFVDMITEGTLSVDDEGEVELSYLEGDGTGLEGTEVKLVFHKDNPDLVSMIRFGSMSTMLSFEAGKRHKSVYKTPYMPFDLVVNTLEVENTLLEDGALYLNYLMEVRGLSSDRVTIFVDIKEA